MAKLGIKRMTLHERINNHKTATKNKAGGLAFKFEDPAEYLLATIGSAMFVEPKYYKDGKNIEELKKCNFSTEGLDEQAVKIINACIEICEGNNPRDILALAHWARKELNMRTTPQIMLAVGAKYLKTKPFVRKYVPLISQRADEVKQVVAAYEHLFGWKSFPASLKKGVSDRMSKMTEYEILKYNTKDHPSFADLLKFCERRKGYPFSQDLCNYILTGEITNIEATPIISARKELTSLKEWNSNVPKLAKKALVTWEVLISQFGNKPEVWEAVIPQMGYMALLRNIRNFLNSNIPLRTVENICKTLSNQEKVAKSKQLPFRFLSAFKIINPDHNSNWLFGNVKSDGDRDKWDKRKLQLFSEAIETALDYSVENIIELPGVTCIAADNSGSMGSKISEKSSMTIRDVANVLCSIIHKKCKESYICAFGSEAVWPLITKRNSILTNMNKIATYKESYRGHSTNAHKVIEYLNKQKIKVDRIIVLSDMQCYDGGSFRYHPKSVAEELKKYRQKFNKNCFAHFIDLAGYGTKQDVDKLTNVVGGFSEKVFDQILIHESGVSENKDISNKLPSLEWIRENF